MDRNPETDKFAKAKIEEPNPDLPLHLTLRKPDGGRTDALCYMKIFEEDGKALQLAEAVASGETIVRKLHRIRNKELVKFIEQDFEGMKDIHIISEATIGVVADVESNLLSHSFLDLVGTADEVKQAEELILENILKTYSSLCFPVILMPSNICWDKFNIPLHKVCRVLGTYGSNLLKMEMESGAWIKIEQGPSPGVWEWERVVNVFGPRENVDKAKLLIQSLIADQPGELSAVEALNELLSQFKEPTCLELMVSKKKSADVALEKKKKQKFESQTFLRVKKSEGESEKGNKKKKKKDNEFKEPSWSETFGRIISCREESEEEEEEKDLEYSGEPENGKQGRLEVEEDGSGVTVEERQQQDVEEAFAAQAI